MSFLNPFRRPAPRAEEEEQLRDHIAEIAARGQIRALVELLPFLPPDAHRLGPEAASAAELVLQRCSPLQVAWFDQWYRGGWGPKGPPAPNWNELRLSTLSGAAAVRGVVALASFHANGFIRELSVELLSSFDDGFELPYLLLRTNDWVAKVRAAAAAAALKRVRRDYLHHWFRCLALLERLRASRRRNREDAAYARRVEELLLDDAARPSLEAALSGGDLGTRRAALRLVQHLPEGEAQRLLNVAIRDVDPRLAFDGAKALLAHVSAATRRSVCAKLLVHRLGRIRSLALTEAVEHDLPSTTAWLERAVLDEARCVREVARFEIAKRERGPRDFARSYRERVFANEGRVQLGALEGLAEVGGQEDVPVFLRFLGSPNARVRAAAIAGLGRSAGDRHHDALEAALRDPSSTVRRAATPFAKLYSGKAFVQRVRRESRTRSQGA